MCTNPLSDYFAMGDVNPRFESNGKTVDASHEAVHRPQAKLAKSAKLVR